MACSQELLEQEAALGTRIDAIVHCTGSGATQAGLLLGLGEEGERIAVTGISVAEPRAMIEDRVYDLAVATAARLGVEPPLRPRVEVLDGYIGPGYGLPTEGMREAVDLCARMEGLLLDPVYSGKAAAGLIDMIRRRRFGPDATVVFIHTGGTPALFAY